MKDSADQARQIEHERMAASDPPGGGLASSPSRKSEMRQSPTQQSQQKVQHARFADIDESSYAQKDSSSASIRERERATPGNANYSAEKQYH